MAARFRGGKNREGRMTLGDHLLELRKRLYIAAAAILVGTVGGWFVADLLLNLLRQPIYTIAEAQNRVATLNYDGISSAFDLKLQIALTLGIVATSPVWLYQIWAFFMPGLTRREVKYTLGFFLSAIPLFLLGCWAGWTVFPHIVELMTSFAPSQDSAIITAKTYFDFVLKLVLVVGVAFVLPVFLVLLNFAGVISAKSILKSWRVAILLIVLFTAIATPAADILSMFMLAIPMVVLYFTAAGIAWLHDRRKAKKAKLLLIDPDVASVLPPSEQLPV
ncbi:sec-independent protein translocase protein TatC [Alpinimonas psychrophila]|uniref:Sec-independent protein translocase protein TatC n=2 Tax=Alpinimonas psychrophila TaxID=748908 RepID=A0A7W3PNG2_9MICO|nr:sec-independent protein translocase protein TatC [Alpinimonas psychrophila]